MKPLRLPLYATLPLILLTAWACTSNRLPAQVDLPYADGNLSSIVELTGVTRTDSTTVLSFIADYPYYDITVDFSNRCYITTGTDSLPLKSAEGVSLNADGSMRIDLKQGIPTHFKFTFPAIAANATTLDFVDPVESELRTCIWGVDLTGTRSANALPSQIPAPLLEHDLTGSIPTADLDTGTAVVNIHMVAYRPWFSPDGRVIVRPLHGRQQQIPYTADAEGNATVKVRLAGPAGISVMNSTNVWSATYVQPGETIDFYSLPTNNSVTQSYRRPTGMASGKLHVVEYLSEMPVSCDLHQKRIDLDSLLYHCADRDLYFANVLKIDDLLNDSIMTLDLQPMEREWLDALLDSWLISHLGNNSEFIYGEWNDLPADRTGILQHTFTADQLRQAAKRINFDSPALMLMRKGDFGGDRLDWSAAGVKSPLPHEFATYQHMAGQVLDGTPLSPAQADTLRAFSSPFYLNAIDFLARPEAPKRRPAEADFYTYPCTKAKPIVAQPLPESARQSSAYLSQENGTNSFVIKPGTLNLPIIEQGNFYTEAEFAASDKVMSIMDIDGIIFPYSNALVTCHKQVLEALARGVSKYVVNGKEVSKSEFDAIVPPAYKVATIAGNKLTLELRDNLSDVNDCTDRIREAEYNIYQLRHPAQ